MDKQWVIVDTSTKTVVDGLNFNTLEDAQTALWRLGKRGHNTDHYIYVREDMLERYLDLNKEN